MENEKDNIPHLDRFIGEEEIPEEALEHAYEKVFFREDGLPITNAREILRKIFEEDAKKKIENIELEKTERDLEIINVSQGAISQYLTEHGKEKQRKMPTENIHFLREGGVKEATDGMLETGSHGTVPGEVYVDRRESDLETALTTFHELWHARTYSAAQVTTEGELSAYRGGVTIYSRDGMERWFYHLDEALTGLMTKRFYDEVLSQDETFQDEINALRAKGENIDTTRMREAYDFKQWVELLWEKNKDTYKNKSEIFVLFFDAQINGRLLPVARLVEKTHGKGSFRKIGEGF